MNYLFSCNENACKHVIFNKLGQVLFGQLKVVDIGDSERFHINYLFKHYYKYIFYVSSRKYDF